MKTQNLGLILGIIVLGALYAFSTGLIDFDLSEKPSVEEFDFPNGANQSQVYNKEAIYNEHIENLEQTSNYSEILSNKGTYGDIKVNYNGEIHLSRDSEMGIIYHNSEEINNTDKSTTSATDFYNLSGYRSTSDLDGIRRNSDNGEVSYGNSYTHRSSPFPFFSPLRSGAGEILHIPLNRIQIGDFQSLREKSGKFYARYGIEKSSFENSYGSNPQVEDGYILIGPNSTIKEIDLEYSREYEGTTGDHKFEYRLNEDPREIEAPDWLSVARSEVDYR